jgi:pyruvate ferredoxin oxidoreductase delta subunit
MTELSITEDFRTNQDWRNHKPVWDQDKCVQCGICYLFCPDGAIRLNEDGYYEADLQYCKGCGLCSRQCPARCITMEDEVAKWPWQVR